MDVRFEAMGKRNSILVLQPEKRGKKKPKLEAEKKFPN